MIRFRYTIGFALGLLLAVSRTTSAATSTEIRLRDQVACSSTVVRLGDVAEISTADRLRARALAALPLMPAPAPGTERHLRKREVEDLLAAHGIDLRDCRFSGADSVSIVTGTGQDVSVERDLPSGDSNVPMNRHAEILAGGTTSNRIAKPDAALAAKLRDGIERIIVNYLDTRTGQVSAWNVSCNATERQLAQVNAATSQPVCTGGIEPWTGRQRFVVAFTTADGPIQLPVYAEVTRKATPVVVATEPIGRGDVITAASLELRDVEAVPTASERRAAVDTIEKLVGLEAKQPIQAGQVVFTDQVQEPVLVKRGDLVTVTSQSGAIRVRTSARARQDGTRGKLVQVESLDTRELYDVQVIGPREAAVFAVATSAPTKPSKRMNTARR